jgi:hypothetical protein
MTRIIPILNLASVVAISIAFTFVSSIAHSQTLPETPAPISQASQKNDSATKTSKPSKKSSSLKDATERPEIGARLGQPIISKWKVGAVIRAGSSDALNVFMTIPFPNNWPEQTVTIVEENIPLDIGNVAPRQLDSGVQQMVVQFPVVRPREIIEVSYHLEIRNRTIAQPADTTIFVKPKSSHRDAKPHLVTSKNVNHQNGKMRKQAKLLIKDQPNAWAEVEAIYDWTRENIEIEPSQFHNASLTLKNKSGTNEDKTFLFVALCRSAKIPARIVFAKGLAYAEFMLADETRRHHYWFPCNVSGVRDFGSLSEPRVILQKGDGIKVPEKKQRQKYVAEFISCQGKSRPRFGTFREEIFDDDAEELE